MKRIKRYSALALLLVILLAQATPVSANTSWLLRESLVNGGKVRFLNYSDVAWAAVDSGGSPWNSYAGKTMIYEGTTKGHEVVASDYWERNDTLAVTNIRYRTMEFNEYNLDGASATMKMETARHEFGHTLGIAHTPGSSDLMYDSLSGTISLSANDKKAFNSAKLYFGF